MRARVVVLICLLLSALTSCDLVAQPTAGPAAGVTPVGQRDAGSGGTALARAIVVSPAKSAVVGQIRTTAGGQRRPLSGTPVLLAQVHWNAQRTDGAFAFLGSGGPRAVTEPDGSFAVMDLPPGEYVILVGDPLGQNQIITSPSGKPQVFSAPAGQPLDIGQIDVNLAP
mgnify:CR=1 FL=1